MSEIKIAEESVPEVVVRITWRQWEDGSWEAWIFDANGCRTAVARNRAELMRRVIDCGEPAAHTSEADLDFP